MRTAADTAPVEAIRPVLAVVPSYLRTPEEFDVLLRCLVSLWTTTDSADTVVMVVDDASPEPALVDQLAAACDELGFLLHRQPENAGFSRAVNVGLRRAHDAEADAVLVNADIEFHQRGWLDRMRGREDSRGRPAAVVGARLLYPDGLIQHAGIALSLLKRTWYHRYRFGPAELPEALSPSVCPVTGALQFIRWETLDAVGVYDEDFRMGYEDVDYCLRVFAADLECVYEPSACAYHLESHFRGSKSERIEKWMELSAEQLRVKWGTTDLSAFVPEVL